jgi:hypothetical protein
MDPFELILNLLLEYFAKVLDQNIKHEILDKRIVLTSGGIHFLTIFDLRIKEEGDRFCVEASYALRGHKTRFVKKIYSLEETASVETCSNFEYWLGYVFGNEKNRKAIISAVCDIRNYDVIRHLDGLVVPSR